LILPASNKPAPNPERVSLLPSISIVYIIS
jgi:hypothetical protein